MMNIEIVNIKKTFRDKLKRFIYNAYHNLIKEIKNIKGFLFINDKRILWL